MIVVSIEYPWTGVRSEAKGIKDLEQLRTIAVMYITAVDGECSLLNSELH